MDVRDRWQGGRFNPVFLRRVAYVLFIIVVCGVSLSWITQSLPDYLPKDWSRAHEHDGLEDWFSARFFLQGKNPYTPQSLVELNRPALGHPPTTAFWLVPLARMEKAVAAEVIDLTTWLLLLLHLYLCFRELAFPAPVALTALSFSWLLTTDGLTMHWHAIQLSEQIAFPMVLSWMYLRRRKDIPAGIALGLAATLKLFPGLLMLFLLFARRYRAFIASCGAYLAVAAVMTATYGPRSWLMFLSQQEGIARGWVGSIRNASLNGIILRFTSPICVASVLPNARASAISAVVSVLLLLAAAWVSRRAVKDARQRDPRSIDLPFALFTILAIFINPWIWEHYHVFLVHPALVLVASGGRRVWRILRLWLDEQVTHGTLAREGAFFALVLAGVGTSMRIFATNVYAKMALEGIWRTRQSPWYHRQLHLMETLNWLPWALMLLLCYLATWRWAPRGTEPSAFGVPPRADLAGQKPSPVAPLAELQPAPASKPTPAE